MTPKKAMQLAEQWTHDMEKDRPLDKMPLFDALKTLLDHCRVQDKDIEDLTNACRVLLKRNKELENELRRGKAAGA